MSELPSALDPFWKKRSEALLAFIAKPRDWDELRAWSRAQSYLDMEMRNCLAWLALQNLAEAVKDDGKKWVWRARARR